MGGDIHDGGKAVLAGKKQHGVQGISGFFGSASGFYGNGNGMAGK